MVVRLTLRAKDGARPAVMEVGQVFDLHLDPSRPLIIGRGPMVDLHLDAPSVGHKAVSLTFDQGGVRIRDLGSGGGSAIEAGGVITHRPQCLLAGEATLWIGGMAFLVAVIG